MVIPQIEFWLTSKPWVSGKHSNILNLLVSRNNFYCLQHFIFFLIVTTVQILTIFMIDTRRSLGQCRLSRLVGLPGMWRECKFWAKGFGWDDSFHEFFYICLLYNQGRKELWGWSGWFDWIHKMGHWLFEVFGLSSHKRFAQVMFVGWVSNLGYFVVKIKPFLNKILEISKVTRINLHSMQKYQSQYFIILSSFYEELGYQKSRERF